MAAGNRHRWFPDVSLSLWYLKENRRRRFSRSLSKGNSGATGITVETPLSRRRLMMHRNRSGRVRETELNTSGRTGVASKSVPSLRCVFFLLQVTRRFETNFPSAGSVSYKTCLHINATSCVALPFRSTEIRASGLNWDSFGVVFLLWTVTLFPLCCLCDSSGNSDATGKHWEEGKLKGCLSLFIPNLPLDEANVSAVPHTASNHRRIWSAPCFKKHRKGCKDGSSRLEPEQADCTGIHLLWILCKRSVWKLQFIFSSAHVSGHLRAPPRLVHCKCRQEHFTKCSVWNSDSPQFSSSAWFPQSSMPLQCMGWGRHRVRLPQGKYPRGQGAFSSVTFSAVKESRRIQEYDYEC